MPRSSRVYAIPTGTAHHVYRYLFDRCSPALRDVNIIARTCSQFRRSLRKFEIKRLAPPDSTIFATSCEEKKRINFLILIFFFLIFDWFLKIKENEEINDNCIIVERILHVLGNLGTFIIKNSTTNINYKLNNKNCTIKVQYLQYKLQRKLLYYKYDIYCIINMV